MHDGYLLIGLVNLVVALRLVGPKESQRMENSGLTKIET